MNIGELSKRTGLSTSRIRFYEQSGLLHKLHEDGKVTACEYAPEGIRVLAEIPLWAEPFWSQYCMAQRTVNESEEQVD